MKAKKKLLLMGVGAMTALALGVGATSTFAWFGATAAANVKTGTKDTTISVTRQDANVGNVEVPLKITLESKDDMANLVLAHYANLSAVPNLESGYIDGSGNFVHVLPADVETKFGTGKILSSKLNVTIEIDWDAEYSVGNKYWSGSAGGRTYTNGELSLSEYQVVKQLKDSKIDIGFKTDGADRGRLFETTAAATDPVYNGATVAADDDYHYVLTNQALSALCWDSSKAAGLELDETKNSVAFNDCINYYIYGGDVGASGTNVAEVAETISDDSFSVSIKAHAAA